MCFHQRIEKNLRTWIATTILTEIISSDLHLLVWEYYQTEWRLYLIHQTLYPSCLENFYSKNSFLDLLDPLDWFIEVSVMGFYKFIPNCKLLVRTHPTQYHIMSAPLLKLLSKAIPNDIHDDAQKRFWDRVENGFWYDGFQTPSGEIWQMGWKATSQSYGLYIRQVPEWQTMDFCAIQLMKSMVGE